jgi:hypothetical protein
MSKGGSRDNTGGHHLYVPPRWSAEDSRTLLNWLSTRVDDTGKRVHPDSIGQRALVESRITLAHEKGLLVRPRVYLPLSHADAA